MRQIPLNHGEFALVDDADFDWLNQWKWCVKKDKKTDVIYAVRAFYKECPDGKLKKTTIRMHRFILSTKSPQVDHWDNNGLNNQRHNLREATATLNSANRRKISKSKTSKFKGVWFDVRTKKYCASTSISGVSVWIGRFNTEIQAARAYDKAAKKIFGKFSRVTSHEDQIRDYRASKKA